MLVKTRMNKLKAIAWFYRISASKARLISPFYKLGCPNPILVQAQRDRKLQSTKFIISLLLLVLLNANCLLAYFLLYSKTPINKYCNDQNEK